MCSHDFPRRFSIILLDDLTCFPAISKYQPQDATTNPSLILAASKKAEYADLIDAAVEYGKGHVSTSRKPHIALDQQSIGAGD